MCGAHWARVPRTIQKRVYQHYRPGQCDDMHPSQEWFAAADLAIAAVAEKEGHHEAAALYKRNAARALEGVPGWMGAGLVLLPFRLSVTDVRVYHDFGGTNLQITTNVLDREDHTPKEVKFSFEVPPHCSGSQEAFAVFVLQSLRSVCEHEISELLVYQDTGKPVRHAHPEQANCKHDFSMVKEEGKRGLRKQCRLCQYVGPL